MQYYRNNGILVLSLYVISAMDIMKTDQAKTLSERDLTKVLLAKACITHAFVNRCKLTSQAS